MNGTPRADHLRRGAQGDDGNVRLAQAEQLIPRAQQLQERTVQQVDPRRQQRAGHQQHPKRARRKIAGLLILLFRLADGVMDGAAHADARAQCLDDRDDGIGDVDGGKPQIAHAVAHKVAVHDGVHARKGKGQHRGDHISEERLFLTHSFHRFHLQLLFRPCRTVTRTAPCSRSAASSFPGPFAPPHTFLPFAAL